MRAAPERVAEVLAHLPDTPGVYLWLRRAMTERIGRTGVAASRIGRLWATALVAGLVAVAGTRLLPALPAWMVAAVAVALFAAVYLPTTRQLLPSDARRS